MLTDMFRAFFCCDLSGHDRPIVPVMTGLSMGRRANLILLPKKMEPAYTVGWLSHCQKGQAKNDIYLNR